jgi:hypothetical protein
MSVRDQAAAPAVASAPSQSAGSTPAAPPAASSTPPSPAALSGSWAGRRFEARSALADVFPKWVTITILGREARCDARKLGEADMALQATVPTGPANDFFAGKPIALGLRLSGAGGISSVPAAHTSFRVEPFAAEKGGLVRGEVGFRYRTGLEQGAPSYDATGRFEARICSAQPTVPSMPNLDRAHKPVVGKVAGRSRTFPAFLAFARTGDRGETILSLKGFTREVSCFSDKPNTPYLFGPELGPGPAGDWFAGTPMPADWAMQLNTGEHSERSVHAGDGTGLVEIESVRLGADGVVRGRMIAATVDEDEPKMRFEVAGAFEAKVCQRPIGDLVPP